MNEHKAGFVNIIGYPNVGKSTLMNALIGERLSIITPKAQTTRHRILGILNGEDHQVVFSDTPGVINPKYKLQESMMGFVESALEDADIILLLIESGSAHDHQDLVARIKDTDTPLIVALNKIDQSKQEIVTKELADWQAQLPEATVLPISALHSFNLDQLKQLILDMIPESPPFYDKDELTDKNLRFFVAEIIREKILLLFKQEVPYSTEVVITEFKESTDITRIFATVYVSRESQKAILLGHGGKAIKKLGIESRKEIEDFIGQKVYLELKVKVSKDWRNDPRMLKWFGYSPQ